MPKYLRITVRFLGGVYHGRDDRGEPEWPPSPLRIFQALVAASASRWSEGARLEYASQALRWLERAPAPTLVAAPGLAATAGHRLYVPDNVGDIVAGAWGRGKDASVAGSRTEKDVRPFRLQEGHEAVHYLWPAGDTGFEEVKEVLLVAARNITHVGWGVDMVAADASVVSESEADQLDGEPWHPSDDPSKVGLRVPVDGTLDGLISKHDAFLHRLGPGDRFDPVPPLTAFKVTGYRRAAEVPQRPFAAFDLLKLDASGFRWFDTARSGVALAGMMRHAASSGRIADSLGWPPEKVAGFILGHGEPIGQPYAPTPGPRLAYIPLPSIESRPGNPEVVGGIRRAMIVASDGQAGGDLGRVARLLSGADLIAEGREEPTAMLSRIPDSDKMVRRYTGAASIWASVTPVIFPGYDDPRKVRSRLSSESDADGRDVASPDRKRMAEKLDHRIDQLIRKAIRQAGFPGELARDVLIEWGGYGFWPGTETATNYRPPERLRRFRRMHVRLSWRDREGCSISVPGPICLGAGRFYGLGLFACWNA